MATVECGGYGGYFGGGCPRVQCPGGNCMFTTAAPPSECEEVPGLFSQAAPPRRPKPLPAPAPDDHSEDMDYDDYRRQSKQREWRPKPSGISTYDNDTKLRKLFRNFAGSDNLICWHELKDMLEESTEFKFSKDVCRDLICMMDADCSGKLGFEEFKILFNNIKVFLELFKTFDPKGKGYLLEHQLPLAFSSAGYKLNNKSVDCIRCKFGSRQGKVAFDDFLKCAIHLKAMDNKCKQEVRAAQEVGCPVSCPALDGMVQGFLGGLGGGGCGGGGCGM